MCSVLSVLGVGGAAAQTGDSSVVSLSAFADAYCAHDFNRPWTARLPLTTQAPRHDHIDLNLAFVDARLNASRARGRVALQAGRSVDVNYAAERHSTVRYVQEAFVGIRVAHPVWIDAGIMLAPFGSESWVSSDNWTYTRSLIADNSPYYEAGIRGTWVVTPAVSAQLHVMQGWQSVSDNNRDKAVGVRVDFTPSTRFQIAYDAFVGDEQPSGTPRALRHFHEIALRSSVSPSIDVAMTVDYGRQLSSSRLLDGSWWGAAVIGRSRLTSRVSLSARGETYVDTHRLIVTTSSSAPLRAYGGSLTLDVTLTHAMLWRAEARSLAARDPVFPLARDGSYSRNDLVLLSSIALRSAR